MKRQIFWSGAIGDIICSESMMTDDYRKSITRMYWASRVQKQMIPLFRKLPSFPNLVDHVCLWDSYAPGKAFFSLEHALQETLSPHLVVGTVDDWSILKTFNEPRPFTYSSFAKYKLDNISKFKLPPRYVVVCPYSVLTSDDVQRWRRFSIEDWQWLIEYLQKEDMHGVVLNTGHDPVPENKCIINLSNSTTLGEAIEIVKKSDGYIGIDSGLAVMATKILPAEKITVVTRNAFLWSYRHVYYMPHKQFDFIIPYLGATQKDIMTWREQSESINPLLVGTV